MEYKERVTALHHSAPASDFKLVMAGKYARNSENSFLLTVRGVLSGKNDKMVKFVSGKNTTKM